MKRRLPEPSRSQWAILHALVEAGALRLKGARYVADEVPARSFAFTPVIQLVPRGFARVVGEGAARIEPTNLARKVIAARASAPGVPANPNNAEIRA
jgi:hypothetical protein